jgi:hypothetical protein
VVAVEGFEWAERNLRVERPQQLQAGKVSVHLAPNLPVGAKIVRLADGKVDVFQEGEHLRHDGYYAELPGLLRYCEQHGIEASETGGYVVAQANRSP